MHLGISGTLKHITHDSMMMILMSFLTLAATALTAPSLHIREDLRMYNDNESLMVCDGVPLPSTVQLNPVKVGDISPCFSDQVDITLQRAAETVHVMDTFPMPRREANSTDAVSMRNLEQRQTGACRMWSPAKESWRRRSPSELLAETVGHASQWISGGFAVQASWTTGLDYQCTASSHQTVCIWYNTAHTAYTAQNGLYNVCTGFNPNNDAGFVMFSPNQNNKGGGFYCVIGTCRSQGQNYWDKSGPAGGP
ncbi:hypothetical protein ASPNIDRAFT_40671 [Aspergillus niger ATCC 1015]|uniref:Uncharacterized protein n=1 Tax=Aspergillus niger (strain ATCC 1015 / CBS 113.46 / FGSC A1144 / LSHB Ac4 / NCTC 3858a / NRRL 328 / USDA 3528.7) TaxID=380704 RepID=G3XYC0_ASPNA|nr:hypothetical protein ASPNIDRAFT_40671 [Aspergillus niger ATCC 1015]